MAFHFHIPHLQHTEKINSFQQQVQASEPLKHITQSTQAFVWSKCIDKLFQAFIKDV